MTIKSTRVGAQEDRHVRRNERQRKAQHSPKLASVDSEADETEANEADQDSGDRANDHADDYPQQRIGKRGGNPIEQPSVIKAKTMLTTT